MLVIQSLCAISHRMLRLKRLYADYAAFLLADRTDTLVTPATPQPCDPQGVRSQQITPLAVRRLIVGMGKHL